MHLKVPSNWHICKFRGEKNSIKFSRAASGVITLNLETKPVSETLVFPNYVEKLSARDDFIQEKKSPIFKTD